MTTEQTTYPLPAFLKEALHAAYGTRAADILEGYQQTRPTTLRANALCTTQEEVARELSSLGFSYQTVPWYEDAFIVNGNSLDTSSANEILQERSSTRLWKSALIREGRVYVQSLSSMLPSLFLRLAPHIDVLDMCAAPGGKTTQIASLAKQKNYNNVHITACEQNTIRSQKLAFNLQKQQAYSVVLLQQDARRLDSFFSFDRVLLDAPCSGSGTLNVHDPKLKKRFSEALVQDSCKKQKALLSKALEIVKPGGMVLYSTCSVLPCENEDIVTAVLSKTRKNRRYNIDPIDTNALAHLGVPLLPSSLEGALSVCPTNLYEGFFLCRIMRQA